MKYIKPLFKKYRKYFLICIVVITLIISGIIVNADESDIIQYKNVNNNCITVYISGEVNYPGKYVLGLYSDVNDLIKEARGLTPNAEISYINLNKQLIDQETIFVPSKEINSNKERININIASLDDLMKLPGIGNEKASSIILYRVTNGPFNRIEDLLEVPGITNSILLNIKNEIKLS